MERPLPRAKVRRWSHASTPFVGSIILAPHERHARPLEWGPTGLAALAAIRGLGLAMASLKAGTAIFIIDATSVVPPVLEGEIAAPAVGRLG